MTMMGDSIRRRIGARGRRRSKPAASRGRARAGASLDLTRWILWGAGGAAAAFLVGWLLATQVLFPKPALARDEVAVPDLTGVSLEDARAQLAAIRLEIGDVRQLAHPTAARNAVVAQDPLGGQRLRPGASVRLAVSQGRARVTVPDLAGMPADAALELARRVGFEPERQDEATVEEAGRVLRTEPAAGTQTELPARLRVVVSGGGIAPPDATPPDTAIVDPVPTEESGKVSKQAERQRDD